MREQLDIDSEITIDQLGLTDDDYKTSSDIFWSIIGTILLVPCMTIAMLIAFKL